MSMVRSVLRRFPFTSMAVASNLILVAVPLLLSNHTLGEHVWLRLLVNALILPAYLPRLALVAISMQIFGPGPAPLWFNALVPVLAIMPFLLTDLIRGRRVRDAERHWKTV